MRPEGWKSAQLGDVVDLAVGQVNPTRPPYNSYLHLGPENVEGGTGRIKDLQTASELKLISGKYLFDERAIVYSKIRPKLNKVCIPGFEGICSADMYPMWAHEGVLDAAFLCYYLQSSFFLKPVIAASMRTGLPKVNRKDLSSVVISIPPLKDQIVIAKILSTWDYAIEKLEQLLTAKRERKRGLMQVLLTGQKRFKEFEGEPWQGATLSDYFTELSIKNDQAEELTVLSCSKLYGILPQAERFEKRIASRDTKRYKVVARGDLVYDPMLLWDGSIGFVDCVDRGVISPAYITFRLQGEDSKRDYFQHLFKTYRFRETYKLISQGTNTRRRKAPSNAFLGIEFKLPSCPRELNRIVDVLNTADAEIENLEQQLDAYKLQKRGLMQQLLTGKKRVNVDDVEAIPS